jgi:hypothetical protein
MLLPLLFSFALSCAHAEQVLPGMKEHEMFSDSEKKELILTLIDATDISTCKQDSAIIWFKQNL